MFTGIIEEIGIIKNIVNSQKQLELEISANIVTDKTKIGDSICTNGVCLTVTDINTDSFSAFVMPQTYKNTSLSSLSINSKVNLERALTLETRLGGHIVSGHIDTVGYISKIEKEEDAILISISTKREYFKYMINKGSVAIDGISLTIANIQSHTFTVSLIPQTQNDTTLSSKKIGDIVNLEFDMFGKYIENLINRGNKQEEKKQITSEFLLANGYL